MEMSDWLTNVFGRSNGNGFELERIEGKTRNYPEQLHALLSKMILNVYSFPDMICLPRLDSNRQVWFYLLASSSERISEVRGLIFTVLGSAYSYTDPVVHVKPFDNFELALLTKYPSGFIRINVPKSLNANKEKVFWVFHTLNEFVARYHSRPPVIEYRYRPVGRVLRDFFSAINVGDLELGEACVAELRDKSQVSAQNLLFLELQLYASVNKWQYVIRHPRIEGVINGRMPRRIVVLILRALAFTTSLPDLTEADTTESVTETLSPFSAIFFRDLDVREIEPDDAALKVWFIGAMAFGNRRSESIINGKLDESLIKKIRIWAGFSDSENTKETNYTFEKLVSSEKSVENLKHLIQLGIESSKERVVDIAKAIDSYPINVLEEVREHVVLWNILEAFRKESAGTLVSGWDEFLEKALTDGEDDKLRQLAAENSDIWPVSSWDETTWNEGLKSQLQNSSLVRDILPILQLWLEKNSIELTAQTELQLMLLLAVDEVVSIADLNIIAGLLSGFLRGSHTYSEYSECLDSLALLWDKVQCAKAVPKYLDLIEELLEFPCADRDEFIGHWNLIQTSLMDLWPRLPFHIQVLTREISIEITGTAEHFPAIAEIENGAKQEEYINLSGKRLAIYSLTEGAARRAGHVIQNVFPDLEIKLNHDKKATDSLVNLAKTSDYFIFASKSAAHQAFYQVTQLREDIIYPSGKGSSSIVNRFLEAVRGSSL